MLRWLSEHCHVNPGAAGGSVISEEKAADGLEAVFRERAEWWGGKDEWACREWSARGRPTTPDLTS
jgi:hypothetical protein